MGADLNFHLRVCVHKEVSSFIEIFTDILHILPLLLFKICNLIINIYIIYLSSRLKLYVALNSYWLRHQVN